MSSSKFFWVYSLSLWEPDAFWECVSGASAFALTGLFMMTVLTREFRPLAATTTFEYFLLGLILMWLYSLGDWFRPTNLVVIFTFIFRLYRKNKTVDDLSAEEITRLFPDSVSAARDGNDLQRVFLMIRQSRVFGPLLIGGGFALLMVALLVVSS